MSLFGTSISEIANDPCIPQIVEFVSVTKQIREKESSSAWIDFYGAPLDVEIVCRYFDYGCIFSEVLYNSLYEERDYPSKQDVIALQQKQFDEIICKDQLPYGTQIDLEKDSFQLHLHIEVRYPKAIRRYRDVVAKAIHNASIPFMDANSKGIKEPARIYLE